MINFINKKEEEENKEKNCRARVYYRKKATQKLS